MIRNNKNVPEIREGAQITSVTVTGGQLNIKTGRRRICSFRLFNYCRTRVVPIPPTLRSPQLNHIPK